MYPHVLGCMHCTDHVTTAQILSIVADNASNNDVLIARLGETPGGINGIHTQIRCLAHIVNLVVKVSRCCLQLSMSDTLYTKGDHFTLRPQERL